MERDYHAENISSHNGAYYGSDICCRPYCFVGGGLATQVDAQEEQLEKTSCEKTAGVKGSPKDRRVAETEPEEKNVRTDQIIARPA